MSYLYRKHRAHAKNQIPCNNQDINQDKESNACNKGGNCYHFHVDFNNQQKQTSISPTQSNLKANKSSIQQLSPSKKQPNYRQHSYQSKVSPNGAPYGNNNVVQPELISPTKKSFSMPHSNRTKYHSNQTMKHNDVQNKEIPVAYFFDKNVKKQVIKNMIDEYFQAQNNINLNYSNNVCSSKLHKINPEAALNINSRTVNFSKKINLMNMNLQNSKIYMNRTYNRVPQLSNPNSQHDNIFGFVQNSSQNFQMKVSSPTKSNKISSTKMYSNKKQSLTLRSVAAKTEELKSFSHRQAIQSNNSWNEFNSPGELPIIQEYIQITNKNRKAQSKRQIDQQNQEKRPHSQQKSRYMIMNQSKILKRRQSGGFINQKSKQKDKAKIALLNIDKQSIVSQNISDLYQEPVDHSSPLSQSLVFTKTGSNYQNDSPSISSPNPKLQSNQDNKLNLMNMSSNAYRNSKYCIRENKSCTKHERRSDRDNLSLYNSKIQQKQKQANIEKLQSKYIDKYCSKSNKYYEIQYGKNDMPVKKIFKKQGNFILQKEIKGKNMGLKTLWDSPPSANPSSLIVPSSPLTPYSPGLSPTLTHSSFHISQLSNVQTLYLFPHMPLSSKLFTHVVHTGNEPLHVYTAVQPFYTDFLVSGNSQQLVDLIVQLCKQLIKYQGKVYFGAITIDNIAILAEKQIRIIDYAASALMAKYKTPAGEVNNFIEPLLFVKNKDNKLKQIRQNLKNLNEWIVKPQYLAPQVLFCILNQISYSQVLFSQHSPCSSDIWAIGCLLFEILTLIPLHCSDKCEVKGRKFVRRGVLSFKNGQFSIEQLLRKQKQFSKQALKLIQRESNQNLITVQKDNKIDDSKAKVSKKSVKSTIWKQINPKILQILPRMLVFDRQKRIKPEQVIEVLTNNKQK